tara:strand:- start:4945 stop:6129 length:1185 start_codon:yes stop_codon:yes gene_type:complete
MNYQKNQIFENCPWPYYAEDEVNATCQVLKSGKVNYWTGKIGRKFEELFSEWCGTKYAYSLANGTLALDLAYRCLCLSNQEEIITTPRSFIATASSISVLGLKPVFADVDFNSGNITAKTIEPLINSKTKAISVVHLGGWPADVIEIKKLAKTYNLKLIEDCSQAHGARINELNVGSFGDIGTWSFCQDKILSTGGEGGMITTSDASIAELIASWRDHGKNIKKMLENTKNTSFRYIHDNLGLNYRMTEIQSKIGELQLRKLPEWHKKRKENAYAIAKALDNCDNIRIPMPSPPFEHAWYKLYAYLIPEALSDGWDRDRILHEFNQERTPVFSGSCGEIYLEKCMKNNNPKQKLINAKSLGENSLMFLVHPTIDKSSLEMYTSRISNILNKACR